MRAAFSLALAALARLHLEDQVRPVACEQPAGRRPLDDVGAPQWHGLSVMGAMRVCSHDIVPKDCYAYKKL